MHGITGLLRERINLEESKGNGASPPGLEGKKKGELVCGSQDWQFNFGQEKDSQKRGGR